MCNYNSDLFIANRQREAVLKVVLVNCQKPIERYEADFNVESVDGMALVQELLDRKPLVNVAQSSAYNIYRDQGRNTCISYTELTMLLNDLNIRSQPKDATG
eukprot:CAMPEP_0168624196 /NCGR_PEP_ID=MMETSP0449_2-20121227/9270_1 /TAXON_ID=1082188 /ORGANISM="Strombidium rassoulzadegani, Strain ras09" /LENGTH=101 /DNA_ID=CAMNT_0008665709 /DNA_START=662 /DNA_END=964 /DNA_ORIENTATION=-